MRRIGAYPMWGDSRRRWSSGFFFFQAEDGIRDGTVTGFQTCALPICQATSAGDILPRRRAAGASVTGVGMSRLGWYARRLGRMSPAEVAWRAREQALRRAWRSRQVLPDQLAALPSLTAVEALPRRRFTAVLPPELAARVPETARAAIVADAERLLKGEWEMLGAVRTDMVQPDWFWDPVTGRRSSPEAYAFSLNQRDEAAVGN